MKLRLIGVAAPVALLGAAALGIHAASGPSATPAAKKDAVLRLGVSSDLDSTDPALAYTTASWAVEYATCLKLVTYPDAAGAAGARLVGEAAPLPTVTNGGRTLTFHLHRGLRFSNGKPVTAADFAYSIGRTLSPVMQSPAQAYGSAIAGADDYMAGKAKTLAGVTATGQTLSIRLAAADPAFISKLSMPFFCAVPAGTPITKQGVTTVPAAGPYSIAARTPGRSLILRRNPYYTGSRPHDVAKITIAAGNSDTAIALQVRSGKLDGTLAGNFTDAADLNARYGPGSPAARAGHQQFFVNASLALSFLAMNTSRPTFASADVRRAVNYALDRPTLVRQAGAFSGVPTDHYLAPGLLGAGGAAVYPTTGPDLAKARALAGTAKRTAVLYTCDLEACASRAAVITADLARIGITLETRQFGFAALYGKIGNKDEAYDLADVSFAADYPDPGDFLAAQLDSKNIHDTNNATFAYLKDAKADRLLRTAEATSGPARATAWRNVERYLVADAAPWAAYAFASDRYLYSEKVGCQLYQPVYGMDLAQLCKR
jgi:ABC-type oligopeptide transport system substrate-binding subunit